MAWEFVHILRHKSGYVKLELNFAFIEHRIWCCALPFFLFLWRSRKKFFFLLFLFLILFHSSMGCNLVTCKSKNYSRFWKVSMNNKDFAEKKLIFNIVFNDGRNWMKHSEKKYVGNAGTNRIVSKQIYLCTFFFLKL